MSSQEQPPQIPIQESQKASDESGRLVGFFAEMEKKQLDFLDDAGKRIVERVTTMLAVLFAVTAFGSNFPPAYLRGNLPAKALVIFALLAYLSAMGAGLWGTYPRLHRNYVYNVSRLAAELARIKKQKEVWLCVAGVLFSLGTMAFCGLVIAIIWPA